MEMDEIEIFEKEMGTHLTALSESYLMNTNMTAFRWLSKIFVS